MFDVEKIKKLLVGQKGLICFNNRNEFKLFCEVFLINHIKKCRRAKYSPYDMDNILRYWDEYAESDDYELTVRIKTDMYGWSYCSKKFYQSDEYYCEWPIYNCSEFLIESIKVSKDDLIDFLNA